MDLISYISKERLEKKIKPKMDSTVMRQIRTTDWNVKIAVKKSGMQTPRVLLSNNSLFLLSTTDIIKVLKNAF